MTKIEDADPYTLDIPPKNDSTHSIQVVHHIQLPEDNKLPRSYTYSEALELIGTGKFHTLLLFVSGFCLMSVINETLNMGFIISAAECDLALSFRDKGMLNGSAFLGVVVSSHWWGFISDTRGRRKVMVIATLFSLIFSIVSAFSIHVWMLIATRFCVGFFISGNAATVYAYLAEFHTEKSRGPAISWAASFMAVGMIFLPALAWCIIPLDSKVDLYIDALEMRFGLWRVYIMLTSFSSLIILGGIFLLPESSKFLLNKGQNEQVLQIMQKMYRWNRGSSSHPFPVKSIELDPIDKVYATEMERKSSMGLRYIWEQTVPLFKGPLLGNTLKASFLMFGLFMASSGMLMWITDLLNLYIHYRDQSITICKVVDIIHYNKTTTSSDDSELQCTTEIDSNIFVITTFMGVIFLLCYIINGVVINKIGKRNLLNLWNVISGISCVLVLWTSNFYLTQLVLVIYMCIGCCGSVLSAISVDLFPTNYRAMALCLILMTGRFGAMVGSNLVGFLLTYNCDAIFIFMGALMIVCALVGLSLPRE
ncbi:synaptic vesicle glycoprotein 2B [Uranotaenia lowii]|uniref:synaptic vesicle glycoprotein 2B n=1 Tax=Uranotaenia lowii TaxID=190385 RepID=UPI00247ABBCF|nr:synaptic vesicle glycoprotein 2B [Uranotaenia lowii]